MTDVLLRDRDAEAVKKNLEVLSTGKSEFVQYLYNVQIVTMSESVCRCRDLRKEWHVSICNNTG